MPSPNNSSPWRLDWTDGLSVGIPEIDAEHRHFIWLVNELNEAIIARMDIDEIKKRIQAIIDDAVAHFSHEEALFREWGYPEAEDHAKKHAQITLALREIMGRFGHDGTEYEWIEAGLKVKAALIEHLLTEDMKYRDYQSASGSKCVGANLFAQKRIKQANELCRCGFIRTKRAQNGRMNSPLQGDDL